MALASVSSGEHGDTPRILRLHEGLCCLSIGEVSLRLPTVLWECPGSPRARIELRVMDFITAGSTLMIPIWYSGCTSRW